MIVSPYTKLPTHEDDCVTCEAYTGHHRQVVGAKPAVFKQVQEAMEHYQAKEAIQKVRELEQKRILSTEG